VLADLAWIQTPRNKGGLGPLAYPLLSDVTRKISRDYGVLIDDETVHDRRNHVVNDIKRILPCAGREQWRGNARHLCN
jgi:peroxiredoxin (alkyl hydroperoxide reductase subunit C)